ARERRRRIDGQHRDLVRTGAQRGDQSGDQRRLPRTRRAREPHRVRRAAQWIGELSYFAGRLATALDVREQLRQRGPRASTRVVEQFSGRAFASRQERRTYSESGVPSNCSSDWLMTSVTPSTRSLRMRSIPAFNVTVDAGQLTQAPMSSTVTTPVASSTSCRRMSPPSAWMAGRIASIVFSTFSRISEILAPAGG